MGAAKKRYEGQVWADMEEVRVHGRGEERRKVKAIGVGGGADRRGGRGRGEPLTC